MHAMESCLLKNYLERYIVHNVDKLLIDCPDFKPYWETAF